jgi:hypothetical protein
MKQVFTLAIFIIILSPGFTFQKNINKQVKKQPLAIDLSKINSSALKILIHSLYWNEKKV